MAEADLGSPISYKRARNFSFSYHSHNPSRNPNSIRDDHDSNESESRACPSHITQAATEQGLLVSHKSSPSSVLAQQREEQTLFLPRLHPKNICSGTKVPTKTIVVKPNKYKKKKLYSRLKHFDTLAEEASNPDKEYVGVYKHGYMTQYDQYKFDEAERKKKALAGEFKLHSGVASAIPLRKDGVVRSQGAYFNRPEELMYNREKPRLLEGPWRPGAVALPQAFSPIKIKRPPRTRLQPVPVSGGG